MKTKLTLSLEKPLIEDAKAYAEERGKSVSQLVSEFFSVLTRTPDEVGGASNGRPGRDRPLPPVVRSLIGIGEGDEDAYYTHLDEKHR